MDAELQHCTSVGARATGCDGVKIQSALEAELQHGALVGACATGCHSIKIYDLSDGRLQWVQPSGALPPLEMHVTLSCLKRFCQ